MKEIGACLNIPLFCQQLEIETDEIKRQVQALLPFPEPQQRPPQPPCRGSFFFGRLSWRPLSFHRLAEMPVSHLFAQRKLWRALRLYAFIS